jgi:hypothetical protein
MLRDVGWCVVTAISGQYIGYTFKGPAFHEDLSRNVRNQLTTYSALTSKKNEDLNTQKNIERIPGQ